jgi:hypothetical protein
MIEIEEGAELQANNLEINFCRTGTVASAIFMQPSSRAIISNGYFRNNIGIKQGAIHAQAGSTFNCTVCEFVGNNGNDSSCIYAY